MAWRVSEDDVINVIEVSDPDEVVSTAVRRSVASGIAAANALTDKVSSLDSAAGGPQILNATLLIEIEKYLAAHFCQSFASNQQAQSESSLGASTTFQGQTGMGLEATLFGQHAMVLDVSGILRELSEGVQTVELAWLGLAPSEQTNFTDRD